MKSKIISIIVAASLASTSLFANSTALKPGYVDMLLKPYFNLQASLSKDNLASSQKYAATFKQMLGHGPSVKDAPSLAGLGLEADKINNAPDLATARAAFHVLSKDLGEMVEHVGTTGKQDIYKMSCPMAFKGKGGEWLQNSKHTANPYYGSMMSGCGSVQAQLAQNSSEKAGDGHSHQH